MAKVIYTAEARVTGGRMEGHGRTSDGELEVDIRIPKELGGEGGGTNPEQLFAVGYASCFESAMAAVGRRLKVDVSDAEVDSRVMLQPAVGRTFELAVELDVRTPSLEGEEAEDLVRKAHRVCPYSNAIRGNVEVTLSVNGVTITG